jgi:hypothetical protein
MADSDVVRARRRRAHLRGDHRECGQGCTARRAAAAAAVPRQENVTAAVEAFAGAVAGWPAEDPRRVSLALARVYAAHLDGGGGDWRMGESLVGLMRTLAVEPEDPATVIDELRARGAAREIERLARTARGEVIPVRPSQHWVNGAPGEHHGELA